MIYELVLVAALASIVIGVCLVSIPAGLIVLGVLAAAYALLRERAE